MVDGVVYRDALEGVDDEHLLQEVARRVGVERLMVLARGREEHVGEELVGWVGRVLGTVLHVVPTDVALEARE